MEAARWAWSSLGQFWDLFYTKIYLCDFIFIWERGEYDGKIANLSYRCTKYIWAVFKKPHSTSVALLVLNSFSILRIDAKVTFSNISFFFTENNFLVILTHWRYFKFSSRVRKFLKKITWKIHSMFLKSICTCRGRKCQLLKKLRKRQAYESRLVW